MTNEKMAELLFKLQENENNGRGVSCVRDVVSCLIRDDIKGANQIWSWDGDKIAAHPRIKLFLIGSLGCRMHGNIKCQNSGCKKDLEITRKNYKERM